MGKPVVSGSLIPRHGSAVPEAGIRCDVCVDGIAIQGAKVDNMVCAEGNLGSAELTK